MKTSKIIATTIASLLFSLQAYNQVVPVQDTIWESTTWNADTIKITGDIMIMDSAILTIQAGTYVKFMGFYKIFCVGAIKALGSITDSIYFAAADTNGLYDDQTEEGGWNNITLLTRTYILEDTNTFQYCVLQHSKDEGCLEHWSSAPLRISHCSFKNNYGNGQVIRSTSPNPEVYVSISNTQFINNHNYYIFYSRGFSFLDNCQFQDNDTWFCVHLSRGVVQNCFFLNNGGTPIMAREGNEIQILNNLIVNNTGAEVGGLYLYTSNAIVAQNTICNNTGSRCGGILCSEGSNPKLISNILWNNDGSGNDNQVLVELFSNPDIYYCAIEGGVAGIVAEPGSTYRGKTEKIIDSDPFFKNATDNTGSGYPSVIDDWSLTDSSLCINSGMPDSKVDLPERDLLDNMRTSHGFIDIGALEFHRILLTRSGSYDNDQFWFADTVKITGDIDLGVNNYLYIYPGTYIEFTGPYSLYTEGVIDARGIPGQEITFTAADTLTGWMGIQCSPDNEGIDTSVFKHVVFSYMKQYDSPFQYYNTPMLVVENSVFMNDSCHMRLIDLDNSPATFNSVIFRNNNGKYLGLINARNSDLRVDGCEFLYNTGTENASIIRTNNSDLEFKNCLVANNNFKSNVALSLFGDYSLVENCIIANNRGTSNTLIYMREFFSGKIINTSFVNNYIGGGLL